MLKNFDFINDYAHYNENLNRKSNIEDNIQFKTDYDIKEEEYNKFRKNILHVWYKNRLSILSRTTIDSFDSTHRFPTDRIAIIYDPI